MARATLTLLAAALGLAVAVPASAQPISTASADDGVSDESGEVIEFSGEAPSEAIEAEPTTYEVTPEQIRRIAGSGNDALRALQSLPGVGRVPFGLGGLVVRGLGPRSTNVYLDGMEVPQLFHFGGVASFYPTRLLEDVSMEPGGFGVAHGRALGGVVDLRSRPVRRDRLRLAGELGLLDLAVSGEGAGPGGAGVLVSVRRSYIDQVLPLFTDEEELGLTLAPRYYDAQLRVDLPASDRESLSVIVFGADDQAGLEVGADGSGDFADESFEYAARFLRIGVPWRMRDGADAVSVVPYVGIERFALDTEFQRVRRDGALLGVRSEVERTHVAYDVRAGAELRAMHTDLSAITIYRSGNVELARDGWHSDVALWSEVLVRVAGGRVLVKPGVRADYFGQAEQVVFDPRINVSHVLPAGFILRESLGVFHEPPVPADQLWGNELQASYAVQGTVGVDVELSPRAGLSLTGFYTELYRLAADTSSEPTNDFSNVNPWEGGAISSSREFISEQFGTFSEQASVGRGRATGAEMMLRYASPRALAWIAYTLSRSERRDQRHEFAAELPYILDQTHVLTAVASWSLGAWYLGGRVRYATGNPYTPVNGVRVRDDIEPNFGPPLSARLPAFFQIDLRVDRAWARGWGTIRAYLEVTNVSNRVNAEGIVWNQSFTESEYTRGMPILPAFGVEYVPR